MTKIWIGEIVKELAWYILILFSVEEVKKSCRGLVVRGSAHSYAWLTVNNEQPATLAVAYTHHAKSVRVATSGIKMFILQVVRCAGSSSPKRNHKIKMGY